MKHQGFENGVSICPQRLDVSASPPTQSSSLLGNSFPCYKTMEALCAVLWKDGCKSLLLYLYKFTRGRGYKDVGQSTLPPHKGGLPLKVGVSKVV